MKIAHWLLSILGEPTPGLHWVAKYSSLAKFSGTKVSNLHHLVDEKPCGEGARLLRLRGTWERLELTGVCPGPCKQTQ